MSSSVLPIVRFMFIEPIVGLFSSLVSNYAFTRSHDQGDQRYAQAVQEGGSLWYNREERL